MWPLTHVKGAYRAHGHRHHASATRKSPSPGTAFWDQNQHPVSTLSTISRSALVVGVSAAVSQRQWIRLRRGIHPLAGLEMHDSASRGPWGSMSLLSRAGGKSSFGSAMRGD
ncbi:hypothetical protein BDP55DRAFT_662946 [Colletotrichum godetiae]|uniref:Uncharacterized protein n=1 Tax=Colletotrichum godetiae TaxID=1209918 RepID=A0AAJ0AP91_9PEZI|nr:uncharacterized protein BDP55DRAFT_662946 [Colletotrichum godetiae]KAK1676022.1 hypothetical protein BDP55DRAFT_662946 [Colletotrichum godetiae]